MGKLWNKTAGLCFFGLLAAQLGGQKWDGPAEASGWVSARTGGKLKITGEVRMRAERRTGQAFGRDPDLETGLVRNRLGIVFKPNGALRLAASMQDSRAPGYGAGAPGSARDSVDLFESSLELFPDAKRGFGAAFGRMALAYGETRLLATSNWGNVPRGFDGARLYWRLPQGRIEVLWLAPVKVRVGEFNRPVFGERVWGTYNTFPDAFGKNLLEVYILRHEQNRPGGFNGGSQVAGTDRMHTNTFGARLSGPLGGNLKYSLEAAVQNGKIGPAGHRALAWAGWLSRRWMLGGKPLDLLGEYKYASGAGDPSDPSKSRTFDILFPSTHDKFGHLDLFGWRNIHNARSQVTLGLTKSLAVNLMYNSWWLASPRDALYSSTGRAIARSAGGTAGRHIGQEADLFGTYRFRRFTFGFGGGRMFKGRFIKNATPAVEPTYLYVFQTYTL